MNKCRTCLPTTRLWVFPVLIVSILTSPLPQAYAQEGEIPFAIPHQQDVFNPVIARGVNVSPDDPFQFDFIIGQSDDVLDDQQFQEETKRIIKYFLASLTIPTNQMWVNLSPYEKNRIIPQRFGQTLMGHDLLELDYHLKQLSASLMNPENELGESFWDDVYDQVYERFGITDVPIDTFNKIWIVPDTATIYEHANGAFIVDSRLKVMLEEDYIALEANWNSIDHGIGDMEKEQLHQISQLTQTVYQNIIIPAIQKEVNEGRIFANLRQIYHSMLLASWYKEKSAEAMRKEIMQIPLKSFIDTERIQGVDTQDANAVDGIYSKYVESFLSGINNIIVEEYDPAAKKIIPKKYFSGGIAIDQAQLTNTPNLDGRSLGALEAAGKGNVLVRWFPFMRRKKRSAKEDSHSAPNASKRNNVASIDVSKMTHEEWRRLRDRMSKRNIFGRISADAHKAIQTTIQAAYQSTMGKELLLFLLRKNDFNFRKISLADYYDDILKITISEDLSYDRHVESLERKMIDTFIFTISEDLSDDHYVENLERKMIDTFDLLLQAMALRILEAEDASVSEELLEKVYLSIPQENKVARGYFTILIAKKYLQKQREIKSSAPTRHLISSYFPDESTDPLSQIKILAPSISLFVEGFFKTMTKPFISTPSGKELYSNEMAKKIANLMDGSYNPSLFSSYDPIVTQGAEAFLPTVSHDSKNIHLYRIQEYLLTFVALNMYRPFVWENGDFLLKNRINFERKNALIAMTNATFDIEGILDVLDRFDISALRSLVDRPKVEAEKEGTLFDPLMIELMNIDLKNLRQSRNAYRQQIQFLRRKYSYLRDWEQLPQDMVYLKNLISIPFYAAILGSYVREHPDFSEKLKDAYVAEGSFSPIVNLSSTFDHNGALFANNLIRQLQTRHPVGDQILYFEYDGVSGFDAEGLAKFMQATAFGQAKLLLISRHGTRGKDSGQKVHQKTKEQISKRLTRETIIITGECQGGNCGLPQNSVDQLSKLFGTDQVVGSPINAADVRFDPRASQLIKRYVFYSLSDSKFGSYSPTEGMQLESIATQGNNATGEDTLGGIDFNSEINNVHLQPLGTGFQWPAWDNFDFDYLPESFEPVILEMSPIPHIAPFIGVKLNYPE